jgi:pimeloyl-ACP methyl ester carboxylesterase
MPDARGHGNSSTSDKGYSYNTLAADVLSFIEALGLNNPVLLGHSMGGMTAILAAIQSQKPLRGLILADPTFLTPLRQQEVFESDVAAQHRRILHGSKEDFLAELRSRHSHRPSELIELFVQARFQTSIHAFDILIPPNPDFRQLTSTLTIPTLLIIGGVNGVVSTKVAAELARFNRQLEIVQIEESGHGIPFDQPERFSTLVKAFLRSISC